MRVHTSNYRIEGFTKAVPESELAHLAAQHDIPLSLIWVCNLIDLKKLGLPHEATAQDTLKTAPSRFIQWRQVTRRSSGRHYRG